MFPRLCLLLSLIALPAQAQSPWQYREDILSHLAKKYHEEPKALGLTTQGAILELLVSEDGETWTLILTLPTGHTEFMAAGQHWQAMPASIKGPKL